MEDNTYRGQTQVVSKVPCYQCGELYEPSQEALKAWAENRHDFDPTYFECPNCYAQGIMPEMGDLE